MKPGGRREIGPAAQRAGLSRVKAVLGFAFALGSVGTSCSWNEGTCRTSPIHSDGSLGSMSCTNVGSDQTTCNIAIKFDNGDREELSCIPVPQRETGRCLVGTCEQLPNRPARLANAPTPVAPPPADGLRLGELEGAQLPPRRICRRERFRTSDPYRVNAAGESANVAVARSCNSTDQASATPDTPCFSLQSDDSSESSRDRGQETAGIKSQVEPGSARRSGTVDGLESPPPRSTSTSVPEAHATSPTLGLAERTLVSDGAIDPPDSVRDLKRAIVAARLAGRHATAELLADRLRERLADDRANVVRLDDERPRQR
jgi:hypothetical protein